MVVKQEYAYQDVFAIADGDAFIIYAPLAGRVFRVNGECLRQIQAYVQTGDVTVMDASLYRDLEELRWLNFLRPVPMPPDRLYSPTHVTLFLTGRCNLRCTYCYAHGGDYCPKDMPLIIAQQAVDLAAANAARGRMPLTVGFHGGGEPTVAWELLVEAVDYATRLAKRADVPLRLVLATNGVMSLDQARWIRDRFRAVTLSLDGPREIQDQNRPKPDGSGSFDDVMGFLDALRGSHAEVFTRSTVTRSTVARMTDMVEFFVHRANVRNLHFEPAFSTGRCLECVDDGAPAIEFADAFVAASDRAEALGANLRFSASRIGGPFLSFCGCSEDPFSVTVDGLITACLEVFDCRQPMAKRFIFGEYNSSEKRFMIDFDKLKTLRSMNVLGKRECATCYAKWNCSGDCPARSFGDTGVALPRTPRCGMIRRVTLQMLRRAANGSEPRNV